jgi:hypothetical protein
MSAIGPKQTSRAAPHMSAFGCKADMRGQALGAKTAPLEAERGSRSENYGLLDSCAGNVAIHIETIVQKNNNMTRWISTIPFHFFGWNDNASANGNMRTP